MDMRTWKKILLQWVTECKFIEESFITLEQTDLEGFYKVYIQHAETESETETETGEAQALQAQLEHKPSTLQDFIKETYPEFTLHLDNYGHVVGSDFIYVYTLLLHYTCVKQPCDFFHSICKKLPDVTQAFVASFFQQAVAKPQLNRECLRQAIANMACVVRTPTMSSEVTSGGGNPDSTPRARPRRSTSNSMSPNSNGSDEEHSDDPHTDAVEIQSTADSPGPPASTPLHREQKWGDRAQVLANSGDSAEMQAPPTPKTELLEQRTKELLGLRAQLETERYEKNVLEEQILANEHLINALTKENTVKKCQLAKLKADKRDEEDGDIKNYVPNEFDNMKRSLMKEINQLEGIIAGTEDKLQDLETEKADVEDKLKVASEQVVVCMNRIRELELRSEETNMMLEAKDVAIRLMQRDKQELELCLQEARDELHNRREVLNASSDLLDCSLSPNTTPENLASSVIDKQLRERELENSELKEELLKMQKSLQQLSQEVEGTLQKFSLPEVQPDDSLTLRLRNAFMIMESAYEEQLATVKDMKEQYEEQKIMYDRLFESSQVMGLDLEKQKSEMMKLQEQNIDLQNCHQSMVSREKQLRDKLAASDTHLGTISKQLDEKEVQIAQLGDNIKNVCDRNKELIDRAEILNLKHDVVRQRYSDCQELLEGRKQHQDTDDWDRTLARIEEVIETRNRLMKENETLKLANLQGQERITNLAEQLEEMDRSIRAENADLIKRQATEIEKYEALEAKYSVVMEEHVAIKEKYSAALEEQAGLKEKHDSVVEELATLNQKHAILTAERDALNKDHVALNLKHIAVIDKLAALEKQLDEVHKNFTIKNLELRSSLQQKQQEVAEAEAKLARAIVPDEEVLAALKSRLDVDSSSENLLQDCLDKMQKMDDLRQILEAEAVVLKEEVQKLNDQIAADPNAHIVKRQNETIQNLEEVNEKLSNDYSKLQLLHSDMEESLNTSKLKMSQLEASNQVMSQRIVDLENSVSLEAMIAETKMTKQEELHNLKFKTVMEELQREISENEEKHHNTLKALAEELNGRLSAAVVKADAEQAMVLQQLQELSDRDRQLSEQIEMRTQQERQISILHASHSDEIRALKDDCARSIQQLERQNQRLEDDLAQTNRELAKMTSDHNQMMAANDQLRAERQEIDDQLKKLEQDQIRDKREAQTEIDQLKTKLQEAQNEINAALKAMENSRIQADKEQATLKEDIENLKAALQEAREETMKSQKVAKTLEDELAISKVELESSKQKEDLGRKEVDRLKEELETLYKKTQEGKDQKDNQNREIKALKEALAQAKDQAKEERYKLKEHLQQAHLQVVEAMERDQKAQDKIEILKEQLSQAQIQFEEEMILKHEELVKVKQELAEIHNRFEATKEHLEAKNREYQQAQDEIKELKEQLSQAQIRFEDDRSAKQEELVKIKQELAETHSRFEATKEHLQKAHSQVVDAKNQEYQQAQDEIKELKEQLSQAQIRFEEDRSLKQEELVKIKKELADSHSRFEATKNRLMQELEAQKESEKVKRTQENKQLNLQLKDAQQGVLEQINQVAEMKTQVEQILQEVSEGYEEQLRLAKRQLEEELLNSSQLKADLRKQEQEVRRLRSQLTAQTQRFEKDSAAMGEYQSEAGRLQEELRQARTALEEQSSAIEQLQRDKEAVQQELSLMEQRVGEYQVSLATLEDRLEQLEKQRVQTETERAAAHERITKLESMRESREREMCHLHAQLADAEQEKVRLSLEIGGLNSEIEQCRQNLAKQADEIVGLHQNIEKVQQERSREREELVKLQEKLAEVHQELDGHRLVHEAQLYELEEKIRDYEQEQAELTERAQRYMGRAEELERQLASNSQNQATAVTTDLGATYTMSDAPPADADSQCQGDLLRHSQAQYDKLKLDCQILQAKYRESKEENQRFEQKIKDQRLEMEGKLDKMKNKMRSLYTAEVTRMKEKQERDAAGTKAELEALTAQNVKYEEHTRKLSNQIVRLNEKILEQQKQHAITTTKLRHLQMQPGPEPQKPIPPTASISSAASNDDWQPFKRPTAPSSNLAMEDEEGEVFNNTYLTDLKLGRVPDVITAEELNYRNSLQPPHLKSAYAAQYDLSSHDEDFKDGPHSLDDSMSALLSSSTSHGTRKKSMGTHYKRPGPPTPSKHGGRLSFGSSEPPREILRECSDHNNGSSKTPARFKFLSSRFSVGSSGLPRDELPRRKRSNLLTGMQRRRLQRQVDGVFCTSTPRKSRSYYDQQRLIRVSDAATTTAEDADQDEDAVELAEQLDTVEMPESVVEQPEAGHDDQGTPHLSNGALFAITKGHTRRITGHVPAQRRKGRVSLCLHGNIFAKSRPAGGTKISTSSMAGKMMQQRRKLRQDRIGRFDQGRHLENVRLSGNLTYSVVKSGDNNNYSLHNRNEEQSPQVVDKSPPPVATTFLVDTAERVKNQVDQSQDRSATWQLRQQFEMENQAGWQSFSEDKSPGLFEQLCKDTASTAPFQLEPLVYNDQVLEVPILSRSSSNVTEASCSTTQTNVTSGGASVASAASTLSVASTMSAASAVSSRTVFSLSSFHVQPLPHVNVTYVQRTDSRMRPVRDHSLRDQCWRFLGQLGLGERLVMIVALLSIVVLCSHLADRIVLTLTALLAGMVLLMVIMPGRQ
ncbi:rootletin isoform X1 [Drosophila bipectinata]|uniref:rootletin isoform X1 n=1 Tax=Drosophila bipectinata TaxID=42026 RepID=UPI001C8A4E2C|nr:golgin subfamily A member 4 [Drosophila bipectinata]